MGISNYSWADGTKNVSLYLDVTDEVSEDAVELTHTPQSVTLTVQGKRLHLPNLAHDISGATFALKPAKSQLVLKLAKKESGTWHKLTQEVTNADSGCYTKEDAKNRVT